MTFQSLYEVIVLHRPFAAEESQYVCHTYL